MEEALDKIFELLNGDIEKNLRRNQEGVLPDSSRPVELQGSGKIEVPFKLDSNGNYETTREKYGGGITVDIDAVILRPDATYTISVKSSDGGGGHFEDVKVNQHNKMKIKTSFWHSTKIHVKLHATVQNQSGMAVIYYSY